MTDTSAAAVLIAQVNQVLATGITLTSTGTPALNGSISLDPIGADALSRMVAAISIFNELPSGTDTFSYPPGSTKIWTQAQFLAMAKGAWQFRYACQVALATALATGQPFVAPSEAVNIP